MPAKICRKLISKLYCKDLDTENLDDTRRLWCLKKRSNLISLPIFSISEIPLPKSSDSLMSDNNSCNSVNETVAAIGLTSSLPHFMLAKELVRADLLYRQEQ